MSQTEENMKILILGLIVVQLPRKCFLKRLPLLVVEHCCKLSSEGIYRKTNGPNRRKCEKLNFRPNFARLTQI